MLMASAAALANSASAQTVPSNAQPTCVVPSAAVFAGWFDSGHVALNGPVKPANSVTFPNTPNCSFYLWAAQMFLWVTSPAPAIYGPSARVFDSSVFFDVSPPDINGNRTFVPHPERPIIRPVLPRVVQAGPHGLPVIMAKSGGLLEIQPTRLGPTGKPVIANATGELVEVARVTVGKNAKATLLDRTGKAIALPAKKPVPARAELVSRTPLTVQKFIVGGLPIFIDSSGTVIEVEQGQADGGVLMAKNKSLIYFSPIVNDVFAYFLTGTKDGGITPAPTQFPTHAAELSQITTFAGKHSVTFPDPDALAIELKASWIDAAGLPNLDTYITTQASIPTYNTSNPKQWTPNGTKNVTLALIGIHVVGSTAGHPEMIWASFEHVGNSPNASYQYNSVSGPNPVTVPQSPAGGTWLLSTSGTATPVNIMHMQEPGVVTGHPTGDIVPIAPFTISPSNTQRTKVWGSGSDKAPNPKDTTPAASNTEIIAINNSVHELMKAGGAGADIRNNYIMLGATWTELGAAPTGSFPSGNVVGTSQLANTTMETYEQGTTKFGTGANCLDCHATLSASVLSHIFAGIKPLF
jgi:hypothetical protein